MKIIQTILSIMILVSMLIYLYGYDISHYFHNQYLYEKGSLLRNQTAKEFWDLRFSLYSVIICLIYFVSRYDLNKFNKMLVKIGFALALISSIDKLILKELSFSKYDNIIILGAIIAEFIPYIYKRKQKRIHNQN